MAARRKRTIAFQVRLTPKEHARLLTLAARYELSAGQLVRQLLLEASFGRPGRP